jgi:hypothetical protein
MRRILAHAVSAAMLSLLAGAPALANERYEAEPTLPTATLVGGAAPMKGPGFQVDARTRVHNFMGRYVIRTSAGQIDAVGVEELAERIAEVPAVETLMAMEQSAVFADALEASARKTVDAATRVVTQPGETMAALPRGIGNAVLAGGRRVRSVAVGVSDTVARERAEPKPASESGGDQAEAGDAYAVTDFARELAGVNKARRQIASQLGIDPYSRSPLIAKKLESLAWASVAGSISIDVALSSIPGELRTALSATRQMDGLAWSQPPADVRRQLETRLRARGHEGRPAREMLRNGTFTPTQQVALVELLERIDIRANESQVIQIATGIKRPGEARFLVAQLRMLAQATDRASYRRYGGSGNVVWMERANGSLALALPLDYVSWTAVLGEGLPASVGTDARRGTVVLAGQASPRARTRLQALGWQVTERQRPR